tara:strand:- start:17592 stop:18329 length:738 start_codon:yes stop_codon:yes gene_type:complete
LKGLAIIPARSGSKGVTDKNIRPFFNSCLMGESIKHLKATNLDLDIIVSTDSKKYSQIAKSYGALVNNLRPKNLANDKVDLTATIKFEYQNYSSLLNKEYSYILLILPTSPFRRVINTINCVKTFENMSKNGFSSVFTVHESIANENPAWQIRIVKEGENSAPRIENIFKKNINEFAPNRNSLPDFYIKNDHAIVISPKNILDKEPTIYGSKPFIFKIKKEYGVDIDINSINEFEIAERLYKGIS